MFIEYLTEQYLTEMPHLVLPSGQAVDLEFERFAKAPSEEFMSYIASVINGKEVHTKYGFTFKIKKKEDADFLKKKLASDEGFALLFVRKFHPSSLHLFKALVKS